ncbi:MAG: hypothetical protein U1C33_00980, partial [Candidatus Cloacimonadaceae bacterium]|nr:hypothetical protein [Candidatus Cloacimonadaceae bacterium]
RDEPIRLVDRYQEEQEKKLDTALSIAQAEPDSMVMILEQLIDSDLDLIAMKAKFRMGWHLTFEAPDTTAAKPFLDDVLKSSLAGEYGTLTRRFYNGQKFLFNSTSPVIDSISAIIDSSAVADSLWMDDSGEALEEDDVLAPLPEDDIEPETESPPHEDHSGVEQDLDKPIDPKQIVPAPEDENTQEDTPPKDLNTTDESESPPTE